MATVGIYAHIRPGSSLAKDVHIDFVEVRIIYQQLQSWSFIYIGNCQVNNVNWWEPSQWSDGQHKFKRWKSNMLCQAPIRRLLRQLGWRQFLVGAGSTITKDVPAGTLLVVPVK